MSRVAITGDPLPTEKIAMLTGKDAVTKIGNYRVRIMSYASGHEVCVHHFRKWKGYCWGIVKCKTPHEEYDHLAFVVAD